MKILASSCVNLPFTSRHRRHAVSTAGPSRVCSGPSEKVLRAVKPSRLTGSFSSYSFPSGHSRVSVAWIKCLWAIVIGITPIADNPTPPTLVTQAIQEEPAHRSWCEYGCFLFSRQSRPSEHIRLQHIYAPAVGVIGVGCWLSCVSIYSYIRCL